MAYSLKYWVPREAQTHYSCNDKQTSEISYIKLQLLLRIFNFLSTDLGRRKGRFLCQRFYLEHNHAKFVFLIRVRL